ncbi:MAG TPA: divergent polysaccharide deacetylase family protein, partial [Rhabdaerophilum sp.]|nr:divergent polysaccharide deacetylase family protein [Rhabdaerophilum sp.]
MNPLRGRGGAVALAGLAALAAGYVGWTLFRHGGERGVVAVIQRVDAPPAPRKDGAATIERDSTLPGRSDIASAEAESGVKVIRQNGGQVPGGVVIKVPDSGNRGSALGADPRVSEGSAAGILPRIGEGGITPRAVYAAPFTAGPEPKIAIVLTGVGIGAQGTTDAISKLPGEVTLAFAPYGRDLPNQVARARRDGHEILLQVPMEPRDYPDSDPGPHTLRANAEARTNIERLHWLMSRFPGYI